MKMRRNGSVEGWTCQNVLAFLESCRDGACFCAQDATIIFVTVTGGA